MDSRVARTIWLRLEPRERPKIAPRAYGSQYGAPKPVKAGTTYTPLLSGTFCAKYSESWLSCTILSSSRNHWIEAPAINTEPSSAYSGSPLALQAMVVNRPFLEVMALSPV